MNEKLNLTIYDTETTSVNRNTAQIVSFAAVDIEINKKNGVYRFSNPIHFLINNNNIKYMPKDAYDIHGISLDDIRREGIEEYDAASIIFKTLFRKNTAGFNLDYDYEIVRRFLHSNFLPLDIASEYDAMKMHQAEVGGRRMSNIKTLNARGFDEEDVTFEYNRLIEEYGVYGKEGLHDALYDCVVTGLSLSDIIANRSDKEVSKWKDELLKTQL